MEIRVETPDKGAILPLEVCLVEKPLRKISFCTQPLYGLDRIVDELPWALDDWLAHHLILLGFEHAEVYDNDGSFSVMFDAWMQRNRSDASTLTYHKNWPEFLSQRLAGLSKRYPYCAETWAYAHCVVTQRALSRWVALLHAPDEYVFVSAANKYKYFETGLLQQVVHKIERSFIEDQLIASMSVQAASFARGAPIEVEDDISSRGGILSAMQLRSPLYYRHMPVADPALCFCAGAHGCYAESGAEGSLLSYQVPESLLVVHHYVEMLRRNKGRCSGLASVSMRCDVVDTTALSMMEMLRSL